MPNTQNEQVKTDTSFEENYIDENVSVKTNKTKEFIKKFMKRKTAVAAFFVMCFLLLMALFGPSLAPYAAYSCRKSSGECGRKGRPQKDI